MSILRSLGGAAVSVSTYGASGAIAAGDAVAVINSTNQCDMTLAPGVSNGQQIVIKRLGVGAVTVTATMDGIAGAVVTANSPSIREALTLVWAAGPATWLVE